MSDRTPDSRESKSPRRCVEHDLPHPCLRCSLLCACGCDALRDGVSEEVWEAALVIEPFIRQHEKRLRWDDIVALDEQDRAVLREALWHAFQRGDVPVEEKERMHRLDVLFGRAA